MRVIEAGRAGYRRDGPRVRDGAAVAFGLLLTALAVKTPWSPAERPVILLAGVAGSGALWWRRRWPVATTLAGIGSFAVSGNPWPLMVGLSTTASRRRDAGLVAVTAVASVGFALPVLIDLGRVDLNALASGVAEAVFVALVGVYLGTRHELVVSLRDRADRAEAERELRDARARAGERARIAREMHDVLAHKVSLIALHAGALEVNPAAEPSRIEEVAGVIRTTARQALDELRTVLGVLRSEGGTGAEGDALAGGAAGGAVALGRGLGLGLGAAPRRVASEDLVPPPQTADIGRLVDDSRAAGVPVELRIDLPARAEGAGGPAASPVRGRPAGPTGAPSLSPPGRSGIPDAMARTVYRVVQEGLTNVHKHAPGAPTAVSITGDEAAGVTVSIANGPSDAAGAPLPGSGTGLVGLRERMRLAGGTLQGGRQPDGGWRLDAWLPWSPGGPRRASPSAGASRAADDRGVDVADGTGGDAGSGVAGGAAAAGVGMPGAAAARGLLASEASREGSFTGAGVEGVAGGVDGDRDVAGDQAGEA